MRQIKVTVKGLSPILMHRWNGDGESGKDLSVEQQAERVAYRMSTGELYLPGEAIRGAAVNAAKAFKLKGRATYGKLVAGSVFVKEPQIGLGIDTYQIDSRRVVIRGAGAIMRHRPIINDWTVTFDLLVTNDAVPEKKLKEILEYAGSFVGVLDNRLNGYGRFSVTRFQA